MKCPRCGNKKLALDKTDNTFQYLKCSKCGDVFVGGTIEEYQIAKLAYASVAARLDRVKAMMNDGVDFDEAFKREFGGKE